MTYLTPNPPLKWHFADIKQNIRGMQADCIVYDDWASDELDIMLETLNFRKFLEHEMPDYII